MGLASIASLPIQYLLNCQDLWPTQISIAQWNSGWRLQQFLHLSGQWRPMESSSSELTRIAFAAARTDAPRL